MTNTDQWDAVDQGSLSLQSEGSTTGGEEEA